MTTKLSVRAARFAKFTGLGDCAADGADAARMKTRTNVRGFISDTRAWSASEREVNIPWRSTSGREQRQPGRCGNSNARVWADVIEPVSYTHLRAHETPEH